jgi:hypothetical protein
LILPVLVAAAAVSLTFDGIALGDDAAKIAAAHGAHSTFTALGPAWSWRRDGGGTLLIAGDAKGKVEAVDFDADPNESDAIDLPGAGSFEVQGSHVAFEKAIGAPADSTCPTIYAGGFCGSFALAGGTAIVVQFEGPGDGQLHRATWATPDILSKLQVIPPEVAPTT